MSLRILFADDSMTAQNMGKKILTEAGYEVVAVSNGAAAVKKIAEHKPDIIILDVYMPGYSGLEVCEKVRSSIDTLKTPVLLTVGKMEPYKAEDANRVKADGVIIKPFEASDLLAIVKKLEERIAPSVVPPLVQQTIRLERPPDFAEFAVHSTANSSPAAVAAVAVPAPDELDENTAQPTVDVPDHMATVSAFSDLLGTDMLAPVEFSAPAVPDRPVEVAPARVSPDPSSTFTSIPELEVPPVIAATPVAAPAPAWEPALGLHQDFAVHAEPAPVVEAAPEAEMPPVIQPVATQSIELRAVEVASIEAAPVETAAEAKSPEMPEIAEAIAPAAPSQSFASDVEGVFPDTQPIPVYEEPEVHAGQVEISEVRLEPSAVFATEAAPVEQYPLETNQVENVAEARAGMEPGLEPTIQEQAEVAPVADPNLVSERAALEGFPTRFGVQNPEEIPVGVAADFPVFDATLVSEQATVEAQHIDAHGVAAQPNTSAPASTDEDFEARVAAAMNLYAEPPATEAEQAREVEGEQVQHPPQTAVPEDDFEARVAAAMSVYEEPQPAAAISVDEIQPPAIHESVEVAPASEPEPVGVPQIESLPELHSRVELTSLEAEPATVAAAEEPPSFEYSPPVTEPRLHPEPEVRREPQIDITPTVQTALVAEQPDHAIRESYTRVVESGPTPFLQPIANTVAHEVGYSSDSTVRTPEPEPANKAQIAANIEAEMPIEAVAAAAVANGSDSEVVAQVVHRVMERLKPELIAAIVRELNSQK